MTAAPTAYVIFPDGTRVRAAVAATTHARERGLMHRCLAGDEDGMLFVFEAPGRYGFWTKNVAAPLDIVWLDDAGRVVGIVEEAPPCVAHPCPVYAADAEASQVLEVAGGFARRHGVAVGDTVIVNLPRPASSRRARRGRC